MLMAAADRDLPARDHYQVLGVTRDATSDDITQAWRRRAQAEHPDHRPPEASTAAAGRFRVLAEAYRVLGDPARRAAYDCTLAPVPARPVPVVPFVPVVPSVPVVRSVSVVRPAQPPLWVGPVRVEGWPATAAGPDDDVRQALLAELARQLLVRAWEQPW